MASDQTLAGPRTETRASGRRVSGLLGGGSL